MDLIQHVYPVDDIEDHVRDGLKCACQPKVREVDGGKLIVHNSFDGRELKEQIILGRN